MSLILRKFMGSKFAKSKNLKTMGIVTYGLELLAAYFLNSKRKEPTK